MPILGWRVSSVRLRGSSTRATHLTFWPNVRCCWNHPVRLFGIRSPLVGRHVIPKNGSSGFFVGGYGLRPRGWEFRKSFGHGRPCACASDQVHLLRNGPRQKTLRANGPGICLAQPQRAGYPSTQRHKRAKGPAVCAHEPNPKRIVRLSRCRAIGRAASAGPGRNSSRDVVPDSE